MATRDSVHQPTYDRDRIRKVWMELHSMGFDRVEMHEAMRERFGMCHDTLWQICRDLPRPHVYVKGGQSAGVAPAGHFGWVNS